MVSLLFIDSEMLPSALLWFLFSTLIDWLVDNELSVYTLVGTKTIGQIDISYKNVVDVLDECWTG